MSVSQPRSSQQGSNQQSSFQLMTGPSIWPHEPGIWLALDRACAASKQKPWPRAHVVVGWYWVEMTMWNGDSAESPLSPQGYAALSELERARSIQCSLIRGTTSASGWLPNASHVLAALGYAQAGCCVCVEGGGGGGRSARPDMSQMSSISHWSSAGELSDRPPKAMLQQRANMTEGPKVNSSCSTQTPAL